MSLSSAILVVCSLLTAALSQTPRINTEISQVVAVQGDNAVLPCTIQGLDGYKVLWSKERKLVMFDRNRIVGDTRFSMDRHHVTDWSLRISDVKKEDSGRYSCQVNTNPVTGNDVTLIVLDKNAVPLVPKEVLALQGSEVQIRCKLPSPNDIATWSYQSDYRRDSSRQNIANNNKFSFRQSNLADDPVNTLVIKDVRSSDEGRYFCRARGGDEAESVLKVVGSPPPPSIVARAVSPNEIAVSWERPSGQGIDVTGYTLFVVDGDTGKEEVLEIAPTREQGKEETYTLRDLTTDTVYTIQLAARLQLSQSAMLGERSPKVTVRTPRFVPSPPLNVQIKRLTDDAAEVTWDPSDQSVSGKVLGYNVSYTPVTSGKQQPKPKTVRVEEAHSNRWKARITGLTPKTRYSVSVTATTKKTSGQASKPIIYLHKTFPPDLSLNGRALSENSVLLTLNHVGSGALTNAKMFYTEASEPSWKRLDMSPNSSYTVVGGLDPGKSYFFKFHAKLGGKVKQSVTHVTTPPYDLKAPRDVEVDATASNSINVKWTYPQGGGAAPLPLGYIVYVEEHIDGVASANRRRNQLVVFNRTSVEVKELLPGMRYNIMVAAFNGFGQGPTTDSLIFRIAESDVKQDSVNQPIPPSFTHPLPRSINVTKGEPVRITCVADGYPVPDVMWFDNGEPIGVPAQGSNQLYIANIRSSTMLTCRASSQYGNIEASTRVNLLQDSQAPPGGPSLKLNIEDVKSTTLTLAWSINGVSPLATTRLHMDIKDKDGRTLLSQSLPGQTRSFNLHTLQPGTDYIAELRMFERNREGREEMLARDRIVMKTLAADTDRTTQPPQAPVQEEVDRYRARLPLTLTSVTPTTASLEWTIEGINPAYVQALEFRVKARSNLTLLTQSMEPAMRTMELQSLTPGSLYYVQLRAFDALGEVLGQSVMQVNTPREPGADDEDGREGSPRGLRLTIAAKGVESKAALLDWRLSGASTDDLKGFLLIIKDPQNRTLLRQEMAAESRTLSLSRLTPRTRYIAELYALDSRGATIAQAATLLTTADESTDSADDAAPLRVYTEEVATDSVKVAWDVPSKLQPEVSVITAELRNVANFTMLAHQMSPLTRSLTVRNLEAGERYSVRVEVKGHQGQLLKSGYLEFDSQATPGMPGRPQLLRARAVNSSAAQLDWRDTPSPSPLPGSSAITGYSVTFATVDSANQLTSTMYQIPIYGSAKFVVIPNLRPGERYMFQVAATGVTASGPRSAPMFVDLPRQ
ncbi:protein sidekick-1-like [Pomacea canaliculata]|nr:protein sidekick-1-like [Pomacea canaliculata]